MSVTLDRLADPDQLKQVWRKLLRKDFRSLRMVELYLAQDPLYFAAHDWDIDSIVDRLASDIRDGTYRAERPVVIRAAKGLGLTRPISHLRFRDAIAYKTVVALGENAMLQSMPAWARMGRKDPKSDDDILAESGWFRAWLERQGQLWVISDKCEWLVETDISNFFPSVDAAAALAMARSDSNLEDDCVRFLGQQLAAFSPAPEYRTMPASGLPQERSDASRVLAHCLLLPLDIEFKHEGDNERYSRWMDDVIVGADTRDEAIAIVGRIQRVVESLGLYPNRAKTRIYRSPAFKHDYMKAVNDYLGQIHEDLDVGKAVDVKTFRVELRSHLKKNGSGRPKAWDRVLRRFYTESRRLGDDFLLRSWRDHLIAEPTSAAHIFDYLSAFRFTASRVAELSSALDELTADYVDSRILALEYLAQAPNVNSNNDRTAAVQLASSLLRSALVRMEWDLASSAIVVIGKHGDDQDLNALKAVMDSELNLDTPARQQALTVLLGATRIDRARLDEAAPHSTFDSSVQLRFLRQLVDGEKSAVDKALGLLQPVDKKLPNRQVVRPRGLFLAPVVGKVAPTRYQQVVAGWMGKVSSNELRHRDFSAERWLLAPIASR